MTHTGHHLALLGGLALLLVAAGCVPQDHGWASLYKPAQNPKIKVVMPPNAPSISQEFLFTTNDAKHIGIDVIGRVGDPVIAAADGRVRRSFYEPAYGNRIEIEHGPDAGGKRAVMVYKHLKDRLVTQGDVVVRGQQIATMGTTGALGGGIPHLHFELFRQTSGRGEVPADPHRFWVGGPGQVTCFDPSADYDATVFRTTYPVRCR